MRKNKANNNLLRMSVICISLIVIASVAYPVLAQDTIYIPFISGNVSSVNSTSFNLDPTPTPDVNKPVPIPPPIEEILSTKIAEFEDRAIGVSEDDKATVVYYDENGIKKGILVSIDKVSETIDNLTKDQTFFIVIPPLSLVGRRNPDTNKALQNVPPSNELIPDVSIPVPPTPPSFN